MVTRKELEEENRQLKQKLSSIPSRELVLLEVLNTIKRVAGIPLSGPMSEKELDAEFYRRVGNAVLIAVWNRLKEIL